MNDCPYCKRDMYVESPYPIQRMEINLGVLGMVTVRTGLNEDLNYELGISLPLKSPIVEETKINYCPMCGRKL